VEFINLINLSQSNEIYKHDGYEIKNEPDTNQSCATDISDYDIIKEEPIYN